MIESTFSFPGFVPACKKSVYSICPVLRYCEFYSPTTRLATPILDHAHPINFHQLLIFTNLYQYAKNQFIPSINSLNTVNFRVSSHDLPNPFLTMLTHKTFNHLLICMNLYQHAKNQLIRSIRYWDWGNFRVLRPHFLNLLWRNISLKNHTILLAESILA